MRIIKNILTIYLIVLSYNTLHAQEKHNRTKEEYHPNGKIKAIITYDNNGFWNGPLITYYPSGDIEAIRFYAPLNSNLKEIEHSQILTLEEKIYKSYLGRVGIHTYYYSKHILRKIELYSCGKLHGITVEFQPSMTLSYYKNGIYKGAKKFDDDGRIIRDGMEISSTYETLKLLNSLVAQTPEVINESYFWDYLYYSKVTDELFTGHWYDLSNLGRIFDRLDKSTYKNQMDSEQKQFWEKKRYAYRSLLIQQIYKPIYNTDLLYIFPQYEGNFLFREVLLMA
ncbi:MAG: hypothetical protein WCQ47_04620, partial [bacterium]